MRLARHPPRLRVLLRAEVGERFGAYLLLAFLTVYLTEQLGWPAERALRVHGIFLALCYGLSLPAGLLCDRVRNRSAVVTAGCILMTGGYFFLTLGHPLTFLFGLSLLALGSGLFKPSMLALVGDLYEVDDSRREEGFTLFYASANLGALVAPLIGEWLRRSHGFTAAFGITALLQLGTTAYFSCTYSVRTGTIGRSMQAPTMDSRDRRHIPHLTPDERWRLRLLLLLTVLSLFFWIALQQTGGSLILFARDKTDRSVKVPLLGGWQEWELPIGWLPSIHAGLVIVLSPVLTRLWDWRQRVGRAVSAPIKMAIGMALFAIAYGSLLLPLGSDATSRIAFRWLLLCYTAISLAEICIVPLSCWLVNHCAPAGSKGLLLGMWLSVSSIGSFLSGEIGARFWMQVPPQQFFTCLAASALLVCALLIFVHSWHAGRCLLP